MLRASTQRGKYSTLHAVAKTNNRTVDISFEQFCELISQDCVYCGGCLPRLGYGLDRLDNSLGYSADNVVPCCTDCNITRGDTWSHAEMLQLGTTIRRLKEARCA